MTSPQCQHWSHSGEKGGDFLQCQRAGGGKETPQKLRQMRIGLLSSQELDVLSAGLLMALIALPLRSKGQVLCLSYHRDWFTSSLFCPSFSTCLEQGLQLQHCRALLQVCYSTLGMPKSRLTYTGLKVWGRSVWNRGKSDEYFMPSLSWCHAQCLLCSLGCIWTRKCSLGHSFWPLGTVLSQYLCCDTLEVIILTNN